jgi:hypothetical protein
MFITDLDLLIEQGIDVNAIEGDKEEGDDGADHDTGTRDND